MNIGSTGTDPAGDSSDRKRAAAYARYSDEKQNYTSNEDQIRECRDTAARKGWVLLDEFVRFDKAKTGRTIGGRDGLQELVDLAAQKPRPFDVLLFHSSSRAARNLSDLLPLIDQLRFCDVELYFVTTDLSSEDTNFRDIILMHGRKDEHFSVELAHNVTRGQRGKVLKGYIACGRVFGYDNVEIPHPTETKFGRPVVDGIDRAINPEESSVVVRIFEMRAAGIGCLEIARILNREGVPSPLAKLGRRPRSWSGTTILRILENKTYIGTHIWRQTKQVLNPKTRKINKKARPSGEWVTIDKPLWRIISPELWAAVQRQLNRTDINGQRRGGLNRSRASRSYIFSGIPRCAVCGGNITIVSGAPKYARYGCYKHHFKGTCTMATIIPRKDLEKQLLDALARNLGDESLRGEIARRFREELKRALDAHQASIRNAANKHGDLTKARADLEARRDNLYDAIERGGMSDDPNLKDRLAKIKASISEIDQLLAAPADGPQEIVSDEEIESFFEKQMTQIANVLASDPERAKREVQNRVSALYFQPIETPAGPGFQVTGDLRLFSVPEVAKLIHRAPATSELCNSGVLPIKAVVVGTAKKRGIPVLAEVSKHPEGVAA